MQQEKNATWKKSNMEKVQHRISRCVVRTQRTSKLENFATIFDSFPYYFCKALHRRCLWVPDYISGDSATWSTTEWYCTMRRVQQKGMQNKNIATSKCATWNRAIYKKSVTRKKVQHEKITTQKSAIWKWFSVKKVQHEKSAP